MKPCQFALVLYKTQPAVVTAIESDKIEIQTPSGAKKVREKDIDILSAGPVKDLAKAMGSSVPEADFSESAEFFAGETPLFTEIAELVWGGLPPDSAWAAWKAISESPWFQCASPSEPVAIRSRDDAEAIMKKAQAKQAESAEREGFIARLKASMAGKEGIRLPDDAKLLQDVEALALGNSDKSKALKEAGIPETPEAAHRVLLVTNYWKTDYNPWPSRHGHSLRSSQVPIDAPSDDEDRLDLTALEAFAIDNEWSVDPDDAVCWDGERLWVHVADPACTVTPDSSADSDARARGSTLYIPEGAARMLADNALDYYALGLSPTSRALSFAISFTDTGAVDSVDIKKTIVRVTRLTYAQASVRSKEESLAPLFAIAERNVTRRRAAGAVFIELPEVHLSVTRDAAGEPCLSAEPVKDEPAADMVREMMLLAGEAAARFAFKNNIPFQYVSQEAPEIPKDIPDGIAGEYRKRRSMKSRKVGTVPADHAGLGLGMYSQVTSPLRRYGDLVSHQQLRLFLDGKKTLDEDDMLTRVAQGDSAARECTFAERKSNLHWILVHLAAHPEWIAEAVVVEKNGPLSTILIPSLAQEAKVSLSADLPLNSTIRVRAGNINIPAQTVSYIPVEA
ncbi:MAG TPA: RNB domain-containing ribonuclease [Treponemataceae bacterium]|nr:RNB domain-containing ribonuclease [Treponemataceae bacterium]